MCKIEITGHISNLDALKYILKFNIIICRNTWRGVNKFVHRFPWICIMAAVFVSTIVSFAQIGKARAERDSYDKKNVQLERKVASYEAVFGEKGIHK